MGKIRMEWKLLDTKIPAIGIQGCLILMTRSKDLNFCHTRQSNQFTQSGERRNSGNLGQATVDRSETING